MDTEEDFQLVTHLTPIDVTAVRDNGMKALVMLAVSLGWNARHKTGQPLVITARDGTQKRLPTNTSIRMSVFQTALSTIMVHTEPDRIPTIELVDAIITATKPSTDHARRLRLSVGESPTQHRERVAAAETEPRGPREPQPLTTRIELPVVEPEWAVGGPPEEPAARAATEEWDVVEHMVGYAEEEAATQVATEEEEMEELPIQGAFTPADGGEHGEVMEREPFQATRNTSGKITTTYTSDTSYERRWADGYIDYECVVCGMAKASPKGVGSHSQVHLKKGEDGARKYVEKRAWQRSETMHTVHMPTDPDEMVWVDALPGEDSALTDAAVAAAIPPAPPDPHDRPDPRAAERQEVDETDWSEVELAKEPEFTNVTDSFILGQITALVAPALVHKIQMLEGENQFLKDRLEEVEGEFDAFLELAASRRKRPDGG